MRKTNFLQIITFGLQRAAGPYSRVKHYTFRVSAQLPLCLRHQKYRCVALTDAVGQEEMHARAAKLFDHLVGARR